MEDILLDFYSIMPGVSSNLVDSLYTDELLFIITITCITFGLFFSIFFYFNPLKFRKSFWTTKHWFSLLIISAFLSFMFTLTTCIQNNYEEDFVAFCWLSFITAFITSIIYVLVSYSVRDHGNAVTRYIPDLK